MSIPNIKDKIEFHQKTLYEAVGDNQLTRDVEEAILDYAMFYRWAFENEYGKLDYKQILYLESKYDIPDIRHCSPLKVYISIFGFEKEIRSIEKFNGYI